MEEKVKLLENEFTGGLVGGERGMNPYEWE